MSKKRQRKESEDDVFNVEKILDKRRNKDGGIEYLIKWENYPMEESTWESEENASCPDLIAEFERERRATKRPAEPRDLTSEREKPAPPKVAVAPDATLSSIVGMTEHKPGERFFVVKFSDGSVSLVPVSEVHSRFPNEALRYYEKRVRFVDGK